MRMRLNVDTLSITNLTDGWFKIFERVRACKKFEALESERVENGKYWKIYDLERQWKMEHWIRKFECNKVENETFTWKT